jgi:phospholipase C
LARSLPYELHAHGREADGKFWIDLGNSGAAGAAFQVYDNTGRLGPWRYTIESGKSHSTCLWQDGATTDEYDLSVHGPNGFFRQFRGRLHGPDREHEAEARLAYDAAAGKIVLTLKNLGRVTREFEVAQDTAYPVAPHENRRRKFTFAPAVSVVDVWNLTSADHWYDLSVTVSDDPAFLRRFAGHMETGRPSKTDPSIGAMRI